MFGALIALIVSTIEKDLFLFYVVILVLVLHTTNADVG